jgi:hypothetical protein
MTKQDKEVLIQKNTKNLLRLNTASEQGGALFAFYETQLQRDGGILLM